jgi:hypothetical protein
VLVVANEIRGALVVAAILGGSADASPQLRRLEAVQARAACALAPGLCGSAGAGATTRPGQVTG